MSTTKLHHPNEKNTDRHSSNRFTILRNDEAKHTNEKRPKKRKTATQKKTLSPKTGKTNYNLLRELPNISSKDYIGKELCRSCSKEIKTRQQAISCDLCERWIHQRCSDMNQQIYNRCKKRKNFPWICNKCRRDDVLISDKIDTSKLNETHIPDTYNSIKKSMKELLIIHMNCRSIVKKIEELQHIISELNPDILCLTETWLDDSVPLQADVPDGYSIIRKDRSDNFKQKYGRNKGGGIAILYKKHIKVEEKTYLTDKIEEILWVHIKVKESFMLGVVYRANYTDLINDDVETKIEENVRKASEISNQLIITGDFNIDILDERNKNTEILNNIYGSYGLNQIINKATRIDKTTHKPTIIDHIWCSVDSQLIKTSGTFMGISDHLGVYMKINRNKPVPPASTITYRDYKNYDAEALRSTLQTNLNESPLQSHLQNADVMSATETLVKIIQETVNIFAPLVEKNLKNKPKHIPWFTNELKEMIKTKNELLQDYFSYGLEAYKIRLKSISNSITSLKRNLKKSYITEKLEEAEGDGKKCWKLINTITGRQKNKEDKEPDMMTQEKADRFNKFFATIGSEIQKKIGIRPQRKIPKMKANMPSFKFIDEKQSNIEKIIDKIRIEVATGKDNFTFTKVANPSRNVAESSLASCLCRKSL